MVSRYHEKAVRISLHYPSGKLRRNLVHVPIVPQLASQFLRILHVRQFPRLTCRRLEVKALRSEIQVVGRMVGGGHDEVYGGWLLREMPLQRVKEIAILRPPGSLLRRVEVRTPVEVIKPLGERHGPDAVP